MDPPSDIVPPGASLPPTRAPRTMPPPSDPDWPGGGLRYTVTRRSGARTDRGGMGMKITEEQKQRFDRDGYLFFPSLFRPEEIKVLNDEVPGLYAQRRPENVREKTGDVVRTNFAAHMYSYPFAKLARHPRMVG